MCDKEGVVYIHCTIPFCKDCLAKELQAEQELKATEKERVARVEEIHIQREVERLQEELDTTIEIKTDLFNAEIPSISEMKKKIDEDESITNKQFALAKMVRTEFDHLKKIIFDLREHETKAANRQRALVSYLNDLATKLSAQEREELKLRDVNYKPEPPKAPKPKKITPPKQKTDKEALRKAAEELGVPEATLTILIYAKNISLDEAIALLKTKL